MAVPNPDQVYYELYEAIRLDKRPCRMIKDFIDSKTVAANILNGQIFGNKRALALLVSPQGRAWLHKWLDDTLDYFQLIAST